MIHTRRLTQVERDTFLTVEVDGTTRPMTDRELRDVGWKVLGRDVNGDWIMDCCILQHPDGSRARTVAELNLPGALLEEGPAQGVRSRFHRLDTMAREVGLHAQGADDLPAHRWAREPM